MKNTRLKQNRTSKPLADHLPAAHQDCGALIDAEEFSALAMIIAERIDIKELNFQGRVGHSPLLVKLNDGGIATIFRYGVVVLFNASKRDQAQLLEGVAGALTGPCEIQYTETSKICILESEDEGPHGKDIRLKLANKVRLQLVAEVMAKGVMLNHQEQRAALDFDRMEPLAQDLAKDGKFSIKSSKLLMAVGSMLLSENRLNGRAEVMDKPDLLWDNGHLLGLYARLESDYELLERASALERKLATLKHTSQTLVDTMRYHSSHRVEVVIFLLIFVELCMAAYEHLF